MLSCVANHRREKMPRAIPKTKTDEAVAGATQRCTVRLPQAVWREGRIQAFHEGRDFQDLMADALRLYLKTHSKPGKVGR
jgi:hypothetical protein